MKSLIERMLQLFQMLFPKFKLTNKRIKIDSENIYRRFSEISDLYKSIFHFMSLYFYNMASIYC